MYLLVQVRPKLGDREALPQCVASKYFPKRRPIA
jgi:hypothetical protein